MELTRCPECGAPATIDERHTMESTDGPVEHAKVRCVTGHHMFFMPVAGLESERPAWPVRALSRPVGGRG